MSKRNFSPLKNNEKEEYRKINPPFSSIVPRTYLQSIKINNIQNFGEKGKNTIKYYIENNLYEKSKKHHIINEIKNNYNKLHRSDLMRKDKYSNFTLFVKREMDFKKK